MHATTAPIRVLELRHVIGRAANGDIDMLKIYADVYPQKDPKDLMKIVPPPAPVVQQPVEIPGVLNQTRNLYKPYTGTDAQDKK